VTYLSEAPHVTGEVGGRFAHWQMGTGEGIRPARAEHSRKGNCAMTDRLKLAVVHDRRRRRLIPNSFRVPQMPVTKSWASKRPSGSLPIPMPYPSTTETVHSR
jgi:hypothetical protein